MVEHYECEVINHLGDITKLDGAKIPKVDVICGGSPCQDLSVAGKREGLSGERSGLFMEQIRIIKEMRESDRASGRTNVDIRPRYMVWENVPGAFSSNKGEDFRIVLEETAKVVEKDACIPGPPNKGKWTPSGCIMGNGWSIAWRVHDAQFWGVPQRRKRISLVADFGGATAPEILFERKGVQGDIEKSGSQREETAGAVGKSVDNAISFQERAGKPGGGKGILIQNERTGALSTLNNQSVFCIQGNCIDRADTAGCNGKGVRENQSYTLNTIDRHAVAYKKQGHPQNAEQGQGWKQTETNDLHCVPIENHPADSRVKIAKDGKVQTLSSRMGTGGGNVPMVLESSAWNGSQVPPTLTANNASGNQRMPDKDNFNAVISITTEMTPKIDEKDKAFSLRSRDYKDPQTVCYGLDRASFNQGINAQYDFAVDEEKIGTQVAKGPGAVCQSVVRRLTPLECERLQGFPDHWTDIGEWVDSKGKKHKDADSPRYKALGNSIALPFWQYLADKMCAYLKEPTMGSLFDGIGGFPLVFSRAGATPVWASEIEEFPIAVTKLRFSKETN